MAGKIWIVVLVCVVAVTGYFAVKWYAPVPDQQDATVADMKMEKVVTNKSSGPAEKTGQPKSSRFQLEHLAGTLHVRLDDTAAGDRMPLAHTCYDADKSPSIEWSGVPAGTRSMVAILERVKPDENIVAPPEWLWVVYNIDPAASRLPGNIAKVADVPGGLRQGQNMYGRPEYTGPCEPHGAVDYALRLFALDTVPDLAPGVVSGNLIKSMNGHIVDTATFDFKQYYRM